MITSCYPVAPVESTDLRTARRKAAPFVPLSRISARALLWSVLLGIGVVCPLLIVFSGLNQLHNTGTPALAQQRWLGYVLNPLGLFLKAVLLYPLIEEVLYRGLILQLLRRYCPLWFAVFVSAALFGVTHLGAGASNAAFAFAVGSVLAWLVIRTRSLLASIVCHATINFAWLFLLAPAFGLLEKTLALDPALPVPVINPITDLFPVWWIVVSLGLVTAAVAMVAKTTRTPAPAA
jgi:membrane protease YdiL (CAAX protease family)